MKKIVFCCLLIFSGISLWADESEGGERRYEIIPWVRLPPACQDAVRRLGDDIKLVRIEQGWEYGIEVFEVRMLRDGLPLKLEMTAEGRFLEFEETVALTQLPFAVRELVEKSPDDKTEVRASAVIIYGFKIEYEDGRPPLVVDASGNPPNFVED